MHSIYLALGSLAGATLFTLIGDFLVPFPGAFLFDALALLGLALAAIGMSSLIFGSIRFSQPTRLSFASISDDATGFVEMQNGIAQADKGTGQSSKITHTCPDRLGSFHSAPSRSRATQNERTS
jgi:hypothetical protein